jgi:hypothetical protein
MALQVISFAETYDGIGVNFGDYLAMQVTPQEKVRVLDIFVDETDRDYVNAVINYLEGHKFSPFLAGGIVGKRVFLGHVLDYCDIDLIGVADRTEHGKLRKSKTKSAVDNFKYGGEVLVFERIPLRLSFVGLDERVRLLNLNGQEFYVYERKIPGINYLGSFNLLPENYPKSRKLDLTLVTERQFDRECRQRR